MCDYILIFNSDRIEPVVSRKKVIKDCISVVFNQQCGGKKLSNV